jgi:CRISPR/Cas system-associated exonuclease Cas4 (RecB family)
MRLVPPEETVESAWAKLRGSLLHYAGRSLGWNELAVELTIKSGEEHVTVVGFIDAYDPETATIYDLKTTRFVKWQAEKGFIPRESHIAQVQCYSTMLENYGIPVARLVLVYVDDKDIVPLQVPLGNRKEWMTRRATQLHRTLTKEETPMPEVGSSCCLHRSICPQTEGVKFEDAMS